MATAAETTVFPVSFVDRLAMIARLYYLDGLGQKEVAGLAGVSQAKVSRLLTLARERGLVCITVADYNPRHSELEARLCCRLGLDHAVVVKTGNGLKREDLRRMVGYFGAPPIASLLAPNDTVALAGGRTIRELAEHLPRDPARSLTIVQAMGSVEAGVNPFDAREIGRMLVQRLGGTFLSLNTPAFLPARHMRDALLALEQVRDVQTNLDRARVALIGLGTLNDSIFVERGVLNEAMIRTLKRSGAVGEICGRFFNVRGEECATGWRDRVVGISLDRLRKIPQVIAVVSGSDRSAAILAGIRGGVIKSLVIDDQGASTLLAFAARCGGGSKSHRMRKHS